MQTIPNKLDLYRVDLSSPIDYAGIYAEVSANLHQAGLPRDDVDLTFHVSPGTPAMAAIWIILSKTRFPAKLIQTSRDKGVESVDFFFDLASDFLPEYLQRSGERVRRLSDAAQLSTPEFDKIIHQSKVVANQISLARRIAAYEVPVLILGETGAGKELFAEAIHAASTRADQPFVAVNCGSIAPELANSELFGHKKGAFTGATADRKGHFLEASGGTLFLDEVGDFLNITVQGADESTARAVPTHKKENEIAAVFMGAIHTQAKISDISAFGVVPQFAPLSQPTRCYLVGYGNGYWKFFWSKPGQFGDDANFITRTMKEDPSRNGERYFNDAIEDVYTYSTTLTLTTKEGLQKSAP